MSKSIQYIKHNGVTVPKITGAGGGKGSGTIKPNSLFSSDILYLVTALGEGPVYRINPNGPQDIQIQDSAIDDLINMRGNGLENTDKFFTISTSGTVTQDALPKFGDTVVSPQVFASQVELKKGNLDSIPESSISENTSEEAWDELQFSFIINELLVADDKGNVSSNSVSYIINIYDYTGTILITAESKTFTDKTDTPVKTTHRIIVPKNIANVDYSKGYNFSIQKISDDSDDTKKRASISVAGWNEVRYSKQAYPRTALIAYAIKAVDEHTGGIPTFTSVVKGLLVKVPANYNQPILSDGQIDWRELEVPMYGNIKINNVNTPIGYATRGYRLQNPGVGTVLYDVNPQIYKGSWDGTFVYSWTQNPVWIIYDLLTNKSYGLGIPEENIDKYKFYQIAMYCDACDPITGQYQGVSAVADGTFRYKPRNLYTAVKQNQLGLPKGIQVTERRFILDVTISDQEKTIDILNKLTATFRAILTHAGGKVSLAVDMPEELPVMLFNETNIKQGSFQISGIKESDTITGVDVSYIEPSNHFKRETVRLDLADANDGSELLAVENIANLDLTGVTRRSQAMRLAQYQIAAARYQRRNVSFVTSTDAIHLAPGDVITVATNGTGVAYGFGGKVTSNSVLADSNVYLTHYTVPSMSTSTFTQNTSPLALRVISKNSDRMELYVVSNTDFSISSSDNISSGIDSVRVKVLSRFNHTTKSIEALGAGFTANNVPVTGDLWTFGEFTNLNNYYTNKSGKLFKVTGVSRDSNEAEVNVSAIEYISNIYVDSDSFINYEPTAYTDITSPLSIPPTPRFDFTAVPKTLPDGSVVVDGVLKVNTDKLGYGQAYDTEFYAAYPSTSQLISKITDLSPITITSNDTSMLANGMLGTVIQGKNGFISPIGDIKLLCTSAVQYGSSHIALTIPGLNYCIDDNFAKHVLEVNDGSIATIKGSDYIALPVNEKISSNVLPNFVGYQSEVTNVTRPVDSYNVSSNTIYVENTLAINNTLLQKLPATPFYITLNQILPSGYYNNNMFYVRGTESTHVVEGSLSSGTNVISLPVKPVANTFVRFYVDGIQLTDGLHTINTNRANSLEANIIYTKGTNETTYRAEVDYYTVPSIEVGDTIEISYGNTFIVTNTTYDSSSAKYDSNRTANNIFAIQLDDSPNFSLAGYSLVNITENPVGVINNVTSNSYTIDYNSDTYPESLKLANHRIYTTQIGGAYEKLFLTESLLLPNLPLGLTTVKARSRNLLGRVSPYVEKSVTVSALPIQKVENILLTESLYLEQLAGVAVRMVCSFDHIVNQEVTDYEISYAIGTDESAIFNTVKVSSAGVSNGRIYFTVNNVDRGLSADINTFFVRITPLNRTIRGITAYKQQLIKGKQAEPQNILNFAGGQQNEAVMLLWDYKKQDSSSNTLYDLDLQDVIINRLEGDVAATVENFNKGTPVATVSANLTRVVASIDVFGTYTYLARTRDTSGNISLDVVKLVITSVRPQRNTVIAAYREDNPSLAFTEVTNKNSSEYYFPSYANATNGLSGPGKSAVDNANGSSSGWTTTAEPTDLLASAQATYITQIRDLGQILNGIVYLDVKSSQVLQDSYNDQHEEVANLVSIPSGSATILRATGLGSMLGYANAAVVSPRYDANNKTWMTGGADGNVWAVWQHGIGDVANANAYALVAGLINANAIALGESFYANGKPTGSNALANLTTVASSFTVVNLKQYSDIIGETYAGTLGAVTSQTFIRTSTVNPYYANGNVNTSVFSSTNDGYVAFETGTKTLRYLQFKHIINNNQPDKYDFTLDKFMYTIEKEKTIFSKTVTYDSSPMTVDISSSNFLSRPVISYAILDQANAEANPSIAVTTAASNTSISFKLIASNGTGAYPANSTANVMITAIGV